MTPNCLEKWENIITERLLFVVLVKKSVYLLCQLPCKKTNTMFKMSISSLCLHDDILSLSVSSCLMELDNKQQSSCGNAACHNKEENKLLHKYFFHEILSGQQEISVYFFLSATCRVAHSRCCRGIRVHGCIKFNSDE